MVQRRFDAIVVDVVREDERSQEIGLDEFLMSNAGIIRRLVGSTPEQKQPVVLYANIDRVSGNARQVRQKNEPLGRFVDVDRRSRQRPDGGRDAGRWVVGRRFVTRPVIGREVIR